MTQKQNYSTMQDDSSWTNLILDSIADGVFTVDHQGRITSFNKAAERITGFSKDEAIGQYCHEIFRANTCFEACPLKHTAETTETIINLEVNILNRDNKEIPISISTAVVRDHQGKVVGAVETFRDLSLIKELHKEIYKQYSFQDILGRSKPMLKLFQILPDIAQSDATVLIEGESGTGKELFATAVHNLSSRQDKPFIKVNCAALPETLLESELFGYKRGAFTDAKRDKPGRFRQAHGGTIFLDEIGDMSKGTQVKLLRVLEQKEYEPLGSNKTEKVDVRIIAATNRDLEKTTAGGEFREDLYYRIGVVNLPMPPLRERQGDTELIAKALLHRYAAENNRKISGFTAPALRAILTHSWSGNVRELENRLKRAVIMAEGSKLTPEDLELVSPHTQYENLGLREAREALEKDLIQRSLSRNKGNITRAARDLGISRPTLYELMEKLGIEKGRS